jgi:hypothetical protein
MDCDSPGSVSAAVAALLLKLAKFEFCLVDREANWRSLVERAFLHLDRLIVADPTTAQKWRDAHAAGETECERLGGAHLLQHGLWAFKAHGEGERTDLVLNEPMTADAVEHAGRAGAVLVLTEWKRVSRATEVPAAHEQALKQAMQYGRGVLGGLALASARYLITVGPERVPALATIEVEAATYRHLHIAVAPRPPSKS